MNSVLPFTAANTHPGFLGWAQGGGSQVGMLAEMLAAGLNANTGGRDQIPLEVEREVSGWMRDLFGFPAEATGIFLPERRWPTSLPWSSPGCSARLSGSP